MKKVKLYALRKLKGYSQQQIAEIIPTDVSNYSRKEGGEIRIFIDEWEKIAKFLDVPLEEVYEEDLKKPVSKLDREILYMSIVKDLQEYIVLLKEEIYRLKNKYP
jgi:transcriptional regulator with XRE-family HTH domain